MDATRIEDGASATDRTVSATARPVTRGGRRIVNGLSVDVEDWFQVGAFERVIERDDWDRLRRRVERNSDAILDLFAEADVKATFFTLGWVAQRHPALMRRIVAAGHEIASHGWDHDRVFTMDARASSAPTSRSAREPIEDAGGVEVDRLSRAELLDRPAHALGASRCWPSRAMPIRRASRRSRTTITAGPRRRASRFKPLPDRR